MKEILSILTKASNKGKLLELIVEDIFKDLNFSNVRRQKSGSQYGYDVIAYKDNECWKAECKNLNEDVRINDIAPKLVWHIDSVAVNRFIIVSLNGISNDLHRLLEQRLFSFSIEIWCGEFLMKLISESPRAIERLGINKDDNSNFDIAKPIIFQANELLFNVVYARGLPFSYDYFKLDNELVKAYSEIDFRLNATVTNKTNRSFIIQEIKVKTLRFESIGRKRVLRQFKQKGNIEHLKLKFIPKQYAEGEVQLNEGNLFEVKSNSTECIEFKLSKKCEPGYYELIFEINCIDGAKTFSLYSQIFQLHKKNITNDILNLCVISKYYDTPVETILLLEERIWMTAKRELVNYIKYLGPTINDTVQDKEKPQNWAINLLKGKKNKSGGVYSLDIKSTRQAKLLVDLKIPINETIYTKEDTIREVLG
jgi:hypothetical protein